MSGDPVDEPGPGTSEQGVPGPVPARPRRAPLGPRVLGGVLLVSGALLMWRAFTEVGDEKLSLTSSRTAPLLVTGLWTVLAAVYLVRQIVSPGKDYPYPAEAGGGAGGAGTDDAGGTGAADDGDADGSADKAEAALAHHEAESVHRPVDWRTAGLVAALLAAYALLLEPAGFILATAVFFFGVSWVLGSRRLVRDIVVAVVLAVGVYVTFTWFLDISLPEGVIPL